MNPRLMRASEVQGRVVVTRAGDDVAQVRDVVFRGGGGEVAGFTLAGRGLFAGPKKHSLPWSAVQALGADAVMIADEDVFVPKDELMTAAAGDEGEAESGRKGGGGDVLGAQVLTDSGDELGEVVDVILEVRGPGDQCDVVGYEVEAAEALRGQGTKLLIPLPDTIAASREHLVVPAAAKDFVRDDLAGFGAAVSDFRAQLEAK